MEARLSTVTLISCTGNQSYQMSHGNDASNWHRFTSNPHFLRIVSHVGSVRATITRVARSNGTTTTNQIRIVMSRLTC